MSRTALSLSSLIVSIILLVSGNAFLTTLLGLRLSIEAFTPAVIGWILVFYSFGFVAGSLHAVKAIERVGHIRAFAVFAALLAVVILLHALAVSTVLWALLRALAGFAVAGLMIVVESWFSSRATNENRASLFAVYQVVFFLSTAGGQVLIRVADPATFVPFTLAAILVIAALIPLSLTRRRSPTIEASERMSLKRLFGLSPVGLAGALVAGTVISGFYNLGPVLADRLGLTVGQVSNFMASAIVAAMVLAWPMGRLCDRFDRYSVMRNAALVAGVASLGAAFLGPFSPLVLILFTGLYMGIGAALYPIAVAITNDLMDSRQITAASTTLLLSYGIGSCIGPVATALIMELLGPRGLFLTGTLVLGALVAYLIWGGRPEHVPASAQEQEAFVSTIPEATLGLAELDPRNPEFEPEDSLHSKAGS
ncbi:MFS transporter [Marinimicrobium locisalis]|uniref:MFS transporter n=1 Tax=Marinimicrobium locisalis TaxID=546022 RepID=UPI0032214185